jgi:hypothetical protein
MQLKCTALLLGLCVACAGTTEEHPHSAPSANAAPGKAPEQASDTVASHHTQMIGAFLHGPITPVASQPIQLTLEVTRHIPLKAEITVDVRLPAGASLRTGETHTRLAANDAARRDQLVYELAGGPMPSEDLVVVVDARGAGFGYHAELPYRYGRPAPVPDAPEASGANVQVGGKSFGKSVQVPAH